MGTRVPEHVLGLGAVKLEQLQLARLFERPSQIPQIAIDTGADDLLGQHLANGLRDVERRGLPADSRQNLAVGQSDFDRLMRFSRQSSVVLNLELIPDFYEGIV